MAKLLGWVFVVCVCQTHPHIRELHEVRVVLSLVAVSLVGVDVLLGVRIGTTVAVRMCDRYGRKGQNSKKTK